MASRLRPTPETGRVAATQQPASAIGPSWAQRGSREARLAFRQAQRRGDREGAMRIASQADQQGLASQASIGSAEERLAGQYQGRQADEAVVSEIGDALTPPARADGQAAPTAASRFQEAQGVFGGAQARTMEMRLGDPGFQDRPTATRPPIPEPPAAPGASQPPENPVTGTSKPVTGDAQSRLGMRRWSPAPQGLAGRQALSGNLRKSIAAGGGELSGDRLARAKAEADRLGISPQQFLDELQDIGASVPEKDLATLRPKDNRSLDTRLQDYQDKYLGGGTPAELEGKLRADAATNARDAAAMSRIQPADTMAPEAYGPGNLVRPPAPRPPAIPAGLSGALDQASRPAAPAPIRPPATPAFELGQTLRGFAPPAVAGRLIRSTPQVLNPVARGVAAANSAANDAQRKAAEMRRSAFDLLTDRYVESRNRKRRAGDLIRGLFTPPPAR